MLKNINWTTVISAIVVAILSTVIQLVGNFMSSNNGLIRIGNSIKMGENSYQISIEIKNFTNKAIEDIGIQIPAMLKLEDINANTNLNISLEESNVGKKQLGAIIIDRIPEKQSVQIIISLNKDVDSKQIIIEKNGNSIKVVRFEEEKSEFQKLINTTLIYGVMVLFMYGGTALILDAKQRKIMEEVKKESANYQEKANNAIDKMELKCKKIERQQVKRRVVLEAKLRDYRLELEFWRDTIRKILYKGTKDSKLSAEQVIDTVTDTLKTYQTRAKNSVDFDAITLLAQVVKDEEDSNT